MSKHAKELRDACDSVRRKPYPIADLIPIMQRAADELERMANLNARMKQEAQIHQNPRASARGAVNELNRVRDEALKEIK